MNIFQRFGNVAPGFAAVGLEEAEEVLGDVFDSAELLLPPVDVYLDSLQESGREMRVARIRVDSFRKYGLRPCIVMSRENVSDPVSCVKVLVVIMTPFSNSSELKELTQKSQKEATIRTSEAFKRKSPFPLSHSD